MARAWGLHPDQLRDTDVRTYTAMVQQLIREADARAAAAART